MIKELDRYIRQVLHSSSRIVFGVLAAGRRISGAGSAKTPDRSCPE